MPARRLLVRKIREILRLKRERAGPPPPDGGRGTVPAGTATLGTSSRHLMYLLSVGDLST